MASLAELEQAAPAIAEFVGRRLAEAGLAFLATTRADGWPRISPVEAWVHEGTVCVGSMPQAVKAEDLRRDGRCCLITALADKDDLQGDGKLFCRAREVTDAARWEEVRVALNERRGVDLGPMGGAYLFELDIEGAAWQRVEGGDTWRTTSWRVDGGIRDLARSGTDGLPVEL